VGAAVAGVVVGVVAGLAFARGLPSQAGDGASMADGRAATGMGGMAGMAGMDMGGTGEAGSIRLAPSDVATFGITFGSAEVRPLARTVRAVGLVELDETRVAYVAPKFGGWAERLHIDFTGQAVRVGQPLLDVYSPELVTAQEELLLAARMLESVDGSRAADVAESAAELYASARRRLEYWDIDAEHIDSLVETGEVRRTLTLHVPAAGVVLEKAVVAGQAFQPGTTLYQIADLSRVWVSAEIFESDVALVRVGSPVEVTVEALPGHVYRGTVEYVYPTLSERTRSVRARVALGNPEGRLKPGMYATVRLASAVGDVLTVPASAVLQTGERSVVFVDMGDGALTPHEVDLGVGGESLVQVLSGLEPGQRVVTSAQFLLDSESNLAEVMRAMMAQMNLSDMGSMQMPDTSGRR
jgi:RND family efflux transporter MFP subunit